ncbi:hypothetical protein [Streptomyces sp. SID13031]|uniref:hypothetical protein n=1 Tax=Streptomyces sp. SID13031 TaxID=2706046 RepID=UPI0013C55341|nr:hypothetical protein [Streptomyces sp. SID13031]NEA35249.1 hypothetical protein [Streptomyces sp. SID13031]
MDQTTTRQPAENPAKDDAWHRHPALLAVIPLVGILAGAVATVLAGQNGKLPEGINPAPPATTVVALQTTTVTVTTTQTVTETPTPDPTSGSTVAPPVEETSSAPVPPPSDLSIVLDLSRGPGKVGPTEYLRGFAPYVYAEVRDASGMKQYTGCYPSWVLKRDSVTILTDRASTCEDKFQLAKDSLSVKGKYQVIINARLDTGPTGTKTLNFTVI